MAETEMTAASGRPGLSVAATVVGLVFGSLFTLAGCVLLLSPIIGFFVLAWATPLLGSGVAAWRQHRLARTLSRVALLASFGGVCMLSLVAGSTSSFDLNGTIGLFVFWSVVFLTLPLVQVVLTSLASRRAETSGGGEHPRVRAE